MRRTRSTSMISGSLPLLLKTQLFLKTRMRKWKILHLLMGPMMMKHPNLHLVSIPSHPTLPVKGASTNSESSVEIHFESPVVGSPVRGDSVLLLETFPPSSPIPVFIPPRIFNLRKRVIRSLVLRNLRGEHLSPVDLVSLLRGGLMSDRLWSALLTGWESVRNLYRLGNLFL